MNVLRNTFIPKIFDSMNNPKISWWKATDPCKKLKLVESRLTDINIIETKNLTDDFIQMCISNKDRIYLHIVINGMGGTMFEKNIMSVKMMFIQMRKLIDLGFRQDRMLVIVKPIIPNQNGLNALKLLLKLFTEFKMIRLRRVRFELLKYYRDDKNKYQVANRNISSRHTTKLIQSYLVHIGPAFFKEYYALINSYNAIIQVETSDDPIIGFRELSSFGLKSFDPQTGEKYIEYDSKTKLPKINIISEKNEYRCSNGCLLCPFK